jgi:hypothetical protein
MGTRIDISGRRPKPGRGSTPREQATDSFAIAAVCRGACLHLRPRTAPRQRLARLAPVRRRRSRADAAALNRAQRQRVTGALEARERRNVHGRGTEEREHAAAFAPRLAERLQRASACSLEPLD